MNIFHPHKNDPFQVNATAWHYFKLNEFAPYNCGEKRVQSQVSTQSKYAILFLYYYIEINKRLICIIMICKFCKLYIVSISLGGNIRIFSNLWETGRELEGEVSVSPLRTLVTRKKWEMRVKKRAVKSASDLIFRITWNE